MQEIERKTCIRFVHNEIVGGSDTGRDFIEYGSKFNGCYSVLGRVGGLQVLNLGPGCVNYSTILHETYHALGFDHEQRRRDRDEYIKIHEDNIRGEMRISI